MEGANESKLKGMKEEEDRGDDKRCDPMGKAKEVIRDSLPFKKSDVAQHSDDILAFSRSVNATDSSLE
ncbi:hypothetical protein DCAR_0830998 [Daucus carota subsp. sativus]|uniref:Uncharacterized protein n=1 Tax=Daucus carota subsp. sativus TaxID=79200 RepID=A0AAF1BCS6_DAUCS|nr:hypothetical protein DCAR_0830998 [Daucus carota subsp. sativus]